MLLTGFFVTKEQRMAGEEDSELYKAIGLATMCSQVFEKVFVLAARFALKQPDAKTIEDIVPVKSATAFKQPIKALLKEIPGALPSQEMEDRIATLIEKRHRVIHRLVEETGWPGNVADEQRHYIHQLCAEVISESNTLSTVLTDLLSEWMEKIPELRDSLVDQGRGPL
jgi:hypothetical protein